jgi:hypothetical protein
MTSGRGLARMSVQYGWNRCQNQQGGFQRIVSVLIGLARMSRWREPSISIYDGETREIFPVS